MQVAPQNVSANVVLAYGRLELALSDIDLVVQHRNFVQVPAGVSRSKSCPAVFP